MAESAGQYGGHLRALRLERGLSQQVVADFCGVGQATLCRIENGRQAPGAGICIKLAEYYKVSVDDLLAGMATGWE